MHWRRKWQSTPVFLPRESQGWGSLVGCRLWGRTESDTTEQLPFHFSLSCIGEGNGNPLQCSCLENPRDGGAWWSAVYGVAQSRTRLTQLSSSSSSSPIMAHALGRETVKATRCKVKSTFPDLGVRTFSEVESINNLKWVKPVPCKSYS